MMPRAPCTRHAHGYSGLLTRLPDMSGSSIRFRLISGLERTRHSPRVAANSPPVRTTRCRPLLSLDVANRGPLALEADAKNANRFDVVVATVDRLESVAEEEEVHSATDSPRPYLAGMPIGTLTTAPTLKNPNVSSPPRSSR